MRKTVAILFPILLGGLIHAQPASNSPWFAMIYRKGANWDNSKEVAKQAYFSAHVQHLSKLEKEGRIPIGGRFSDKGFMLLKAGSMEAAQAVIKQDLSVTNGVFTVELHPFSPFYYGCIGKEVDPGPTNAKVTGLGGIFFKTIDADRLTAWYQEHLGIPTEMQSATFEWKKANGDPSPGFTAWHPYDSADSHLSISDQPFMITYRVRDLPSLLARLRASGIEIVSELENSLGKFARTRDVDGNLIELWEPNDVQYSQSIGVRIKSH